MPNIYLRVPVYVAAFYRNRDEKKHLEKAEPVEFDELSYEVWMIRQGLRPDRSKGQLTVLCYSQQSWDNIVKGKLPYGGKTIISRDPASWPSPSEICTLEGRQLKLHEEMFDYLCIAAPREALIGGNVVRVTKTFALDGKTAQKMGNHLRNEFYHYFMEWCIQEHRIFRSKGLAITKAEMMERFYAQYDIPMRPDARNINTMRILAKRLFKRAASALPNGRTPIKGDYFDYVGDGMKETEDADFGK